VATEYTPPVNVMSIVDSSPIVAFTTGSDSRNAPVMVMRGFVALVVPVTGLTVKFVEVPTNVFKVAQVSEVAYDIYRVNVTSLASSPPTYFLATSPKAVLSRASIVRVKVAAEQLSDKSTVATVTIGLLRYVLVAILVCVLFYGFSGFGCFNETALDKGVDVDAFYGDVFGAGFSDAG
jgi:hypothetical protein